MTAFKGTADEAVAPPRWFRDEDGTEWARPHKAGEGCPWGFCADMDYLEWGDAPDAPGAPGTDRPFCHTVEGDRQNWEDFVEERTVIKEIE